MNDSLTFHEEFSNFSLAMSCTFLVSARKVPQRSRHRRGASSKCALSYVPHPPHRHPAFKNVPIFERLHSANLQVCTVEPAENRNIFSGRWLTRREWGPGRVVLRAANPNRSLAGGKRSAISAFARNASPRTTSLVSFLFGHKKVTSCIGSINSNLNNKSHEMIHKKIAFSKILCYILKLENK